MSAHQMHISVKAKVLANQIAQLQSNLNNLRSVQTEFNQEQIPALHRRHGWLNPDERKRIVNYFKSGISSIEIAGKFACSVPTVYYCFRKLEGQPTRVTQSNLF